MDDLETVDGAAGADDREDRYRAPALDKGLDILELLADQPAGLTRAEIVTAMRRRPSEIYRMLERLVARDYVTRTVEGDRYHLSMKLFVLAHRFPPVRRLVAEAQPLMDAFARDTRQSCHLAIPDRDAATVIARATSPGPLEYGIRIGARLDYLATGSGQTFLAFKPRDARREFVARWLGADGVRALEPLDADLEVYRRQGFRSAPSRQVRGVDDITVPVLDTFGEAVAVITCPHLDRLDQAPEPRRHVIAELKAIADRLSLT